MNWKEQYLDTLRILSEVRKERDVLEAENKKLQEILAFDATHITVQKIPCPRCQTYVEVQLPYQRDSFALSVAKKNMELEKERDALRTEVNALRDFAQECVTCWPDANDDWLEETAKYTAQLRKRLAASRQQELQA